MPVVTPTVPVASEPLEVKAEPVAEAAANMASPPAVVAADAQVPAAAAPKSARDVAIDQLVGMGFRADRAGVALDAAGGAIGAAVEMLLAQM